MIRELIALALAVGLFVGLAERAAAQPDEAAGVPAEASAESSGMPSEASGEPSEASGEPSEASGEPSEASGEPLEASGEPSEASAEPSPPRLPRLPDASIERHRTPFDTLMESAIGRTSKRLRYDWRKATAEVGLTGSLPAELNNFDSLRGGIFGRFPVGGLLIGLEASYVWVSGSTSTERLALTPYRQPARPERVELDLTLAFPLAEGVVTAFPSWFPSAQLVLQSHLDLRYLLYPGAFEGFTFTETVQALVAGSLSDREVANLEDIRLPAMEIDRSRYGFLAGLGADLYFASGFFVSHKVLVALPLFALATDSELLFAIELHLLTGFSF